MDVRIAALFLILEVYRAFCYKSLMDRIPNGHHVTNPCDPTKMWEGVGHLLAKGYGKRNKFGADFKKYNLVWGKDMCMTDSDGDGRTNGQELGDPSCTWRPGSDVSLDTSNVTHPGICEPLDTPECKRRNQWLKCNTEFKCEAINNPDTKNTTIKFPKQRVPIQQTTHTCMIIEFPQDGDYHIVATKPFLDNRKVMHHILLYGCDDEKTPVHAVNEPYECGMAFDPACRDLMSLWLLGMEGECPHEKAGFRIGTRGYKRGGIQLHWENQALSPNEVDGSGLTIFYTAGTRLHDAGILFIGQDYMVIPPGEPRHVETGLCSGDCTARKFSGNVHITAAVNHMHYLGRSMKIEQLRGNRTISVITNEDDYQYDSPIMHSFTTPFVFRPGDELRTTCVFDSASRNLTTLAGSGYQEEMCFGFVTYFPKQALSLGNPACTSWKTIPTCQFELDTKVEGCDFRHVHNLSSPVTKRIYDDVTAHCRPFGPCFEECLLVVKETQQHPCYHGNMWDWQRNKILSTNTPEDVRLKWFRFYAAFDSCAYFNDNKRLPSLAMIDKKANNSSSLPSSTSSKYRTSYIRILILLLTVLTLRAGTTQ